MQLDYGKALLGNLFLKEIRYQSRARYRVQKALIVLTVQQRPPSLHSCDSCTPVTPALPALPWGYVCEKLYTLSQVCANLPVAPLPLNDR